MKEDEKYSIVLNSLEIIENAIAKNLSAKVIKEQVVVESGYEGKYFNSIFKQYIKCSISEYIRTMYLLTQYRKWLTEKKYLTKKATYNGLKYFPINFERAFGECLSEADEKRILSKAKITKKEFQKLKFELEIFDLFRFYLLTEEGVEKMLKNKELLQQFLYNYLTEYVEDNRDEFSEAEEWSDYSFMEDLEWNQRYVETSNFELDEIEFEVDEEKQIITGKAWVYYDVSARTTEFYFSEDEEVDDFVLGKERTISSFYFYINYDKTNLTNSSCEIEVGVTNCW